MVPVGLIRVLFDFAVLHYASKGLRVDPGWMAECCSSIGRSWAVENESLMATYELSVEEVCAYSARLGKYLGEFFNQERGGL